MVNNTKFEVQDIDCVVKNHLYSILYKIFDFDEFSRLFDLWDDPIYLEGFFEMNKEDLENEFWGSMSIEEAIIKTRNDALDLEDHLISIAEEGKLETGENLSSFFHPLSKNYFEEKFESNKAYGQDSPSWLRIYALKIELDFFVVTGGAIKLTATMNDREHLKTELDKLNIAREFIKDYPYSFEGEDIAFFELIY